MNILISAYACNPKQGSEPGLVWRVVSGIARYHTVYVITDDEGKTDIDAAISESGLTTLHFVYNPVPEKVRKMCDNQGDWRFYYHYRKWQKKTYEIAKRIVTEQSIDVVHHLGMITFREPGYLINLSKPFVWGPIGGMNHAPVRYLKDVSFGVKFKYEIKNMLSTLQYRCVPRIVKTIKNADVVIAANSSSYKVLTEIYHRETYKINETGCESWNLQLNKQDHPERFDILWVGRFIPTKLLGFSLEVISKLKELPGIRFHVIGEAFIKSETKQYKEKAKQLGISEICQWYGWITHDKVQQLMMQSDMMFFPSVVEGTPHVVLEAVANNLPVVCFDTCGQADIIDDTIGVKVPLTNYEQSKKEFVHVIRDLYQNRSIVQELSDNCNRKKESLSWENKIKKYLEIYEKVSRRKLQ